MVTSASCLIHLKQQKGGARLPAWPPLRGAVYNSRLRDSQKETPNRTSCGCKIPRCQELKIAATGPSSGKGAGLLRRPEDRLCGSHIQACCCTAAEPAGLQSPGPDRPEACVGAAPRPRPAHLAAQPLPPWAAGPSAWLWEADENASEGLGTSREGIWQSTREQGQ